MNDYLIKRATMYVLVIETILVQVKLFPIRNKICIVRLFIFSQWEVYRNFHANTGITEPVLPSRTFSFFSAKLR